MSSVSIVSSGGASLQPNRRSQEDHQQTAGDRIVATLFRVPRHSAVGRTHGVPSRSSERGNAACPRRDAQRDMTPINTINNRIGISQRCRWRSG